MATEKVIYELSLRDLMSKGLSDINNKMAQMEGKLAGVQKSAKKTSGSFMDSFGGMKAAASGFLATMAVGQIVSFADENIRAAAKMEGMGNAIRFASGSAEEGEKNMKFLKNITQTMPIDLMAAQEGFKTFSGAVMGSSLEGEQARKIFTSVSKAASVMGLSADETKGIFLALGQMVSKGTVQAEELKGQLGERLPGAFQLAAKSMGLTTRQLQDQMKAGNITAEDMLPRLAVELDKTFGRGMGEANKSINAQIVKLENFRHELTEGSIPIVKSFMMTLVDGVENIRGSWEPMRDMFSGLGNVFVEIFSPLEKFFGMFSGSTIITLENFFKVLGTAIMVIASPIRILADAVNSLYEALASLFTLDFDRLTKINPGGVVDRIGGDISKIWTDDKAPGSKFKAPGSKFGSLETSQETSFAKLDLGGKDKAKKLKEQSASVEGGVPKVVNINIEALIKDVKNNFGSSAMNVQNDAKSFLDQLQQALQMIITDTAYITQAK